MEQKNLRRRPALRRGLNEAGVALMTVEVVRPMLRPHRHDLVELVAVVEGRVLHEIEGLERERGPGAVDMVPPGALHRYRPLAGPCRIVNLICDPLACSLTGLDAETATAVERIAGSRARRPLRLDPGAALAPPLAGLASEQERRGGGAPAALRAWYRLLLISLARALPQDAEPAAEADAALTALRREIDEHPERAWDLAGIATRLGVGREQACRRFAATLACSPMAYVTRRRLALAQDLLLAGRGVADAARAAGFASRGAVHRACVAAHGCGPRAWLHRQG